MVFLLFGVKIPFFGIDYKMFMGAFFFYIGYWLKLNYSFVSQAKVKCSLVFFTLLIAPVVALELPSSMPTMESSKAIAYMVSAVLMTISIYFMFEYMAKYKTVVGSLLNYVGQHTLEILTWHFLLFKMVSFVIVKAYGLPIGQVACYPAIQEYSSRGWWVVYTLVGVMLPVALAYGKNKIKLRK